MSIQHINDPTDVIMRAKKNSKGNLWYVTEINNGRQEHTYIGDEDDTESLSLDNDEIVGASPTDISLQYQKQQSTFKSQPEYDKWHQRLGHIGPEKLRQLNHVTTLAKAIQRGTLPCDTCSGITMLTKGIEQTSSHCETCSTAKSKKRRNHTISDRKNELLEQISIDTCGKLFTSLWGHVYFLQIINSHFYYITVISTKDKDKYADELQKWKVQAELHTGLKVKIARSDNAPELLKVIGEWANETGVREDSTAPYTSSQNDLAERAIQNVEQIARAMFIEAKLPIGF